MRAPARYKTHTTTLTTMANRRKWLPNAPNEASIPATTCCTDGKQPPEQVVIIWGGVRGCMVIKVLLCSGNDASPQHWSVLRAIYSLTPPKIITACSGGLPLSSEDDDGAGRKNSCGAQGGHFHRRWPWSVVVEMVVVGRWRLVTSYVF